MGKDLSVKEAPAGGKFLSFILGDVAYGIPILEVREIIGMAPITPLPNAPSFFLGVVNLRGKIIPVLDLRTRLGLARAETTSESCIIVVDCDRGTDEARQIGCLVDSVSEVVNVSSEQIEPAAWEGTTDSLTGLAKLKDRVLVLLNVQQVVGAAAQAALC